MEIDTPAHAGNGWQWGESAGLGALALCINRNPWRQYCIQPPCGQLNPINPNTYKVLGQIFKDLVSVFPKGEVYHMGGDEVNKFPRSNRLGTGTRSGQFETRFNIFFFNSFLTASFPMLERNERDHRIHG